jgi:hypothetical protein
LPRALPAASSIYRVLFDGLIVLDDVPPGDGAYDWAPAPSDRGKAGGSLATWFSLPLGGPEQLVLPGFHTAAENGLRRGQPTGDEMFLSLCGLMSSGVRTILISRWRTGGQTSFGLVREFAQELPHISPAEAWQRSVQVALDTQIEPSLEPRVKKSPATTEPPKADHPLFWAGYMLVDSGVMPEGQDKALTIPGLNAPDKAKPAQPANPPLAPPAFNPPVAMPPDAEQPEPPVKKAKPQPRATTKKAPRQKPAQPDDSQ